MKNINTLLLILTVFTFSAFTFDIINSYKISDNYSIKFDGRGATGTFEGLTGEIIFDENNLQDSRMKVNIDATTISTGSDLKDKHARGKSWFDTEKFPKITFQSEKFSKTTEGFTVIGMFEIHGFKKQETIPFTFQDDVFEGTFSINRQEYGIEGPFFSFTVSDEFDVSLRVPVSK